MKLFLKDKKDKWIMFPLVTDEYLGFNSKNHKLLHETNNDNDIDTDEEQVYKGQNKCYYDLRKAIEKRFQWSKPSFCS